MCVLAVGTCVEKTSTSLGCDGYTDGKIVDHPSIYCIYVLKLSKTRDPVS